MIQDVFKEIGERWGAIDAQQESQPCMESPEGAIRRPKKVAAREHSLLREVPSMACGGSQKGTLPLEVF